MVSTSQVNKEMTWKHIKAIKATNYAKHNSDCAVTLIYNEDIIINLQNFSRLLNISNVSNEVENFSAKNINEAGEMFINLNSCPHDVEIAVDYWDIFYTFNIIGKPTASILLTLLKTINYSSEDGRKIALTILQKLLLEMNVGQNEFKRLTQAENYNFKLLRDLKGI